MSGPGATRVGHRLDPFWAAIIEFFSVPPHPREKSVLSINQFSEFARGVAQSLCYLTSPSSDFHFVWARAVIGMNLRCRSDEVDRVKVRRPRARPAGAGQSVHGVRRTTSWLRFCVVLHLHAGIHTRVPLRSATLTHRNHCAVRHTTFFVISGGP